MALTKLIECPDNWKAELIKGALASEGISCVLQGETMNAVYAGINALPVNVLVDEDDLARAREVIKE